MARIVTRTLRHTLMHLSRIAVLGILLAAGAATLSHATPSRAQVVVMDPPDSLLYDDIIGTNLQPTRVILTYQTHGDNSTATGNPDEIVPSCITVRYGTVSQATVFPVSGRSYPSTWQEYVSCPAGGGNGGDHVVTLTGLNPGTRYYANVHAEYPGTPTLSTDTILSGATYYDEVMFITSTYDATSVSATISPTGPPYTAVIRWRSTSGVNAKLLWNYLPGLDKTACASIVPAGGVYTCTIANLNGSTPVYFEIQYLGTPLTGMGLMRFAIGPINLVGTPTAVSNGAGTGANITWTTNMNGTHLIDYSTDNMLTSGVTRLSNTASSLTTHSVTIPAGALDPGTTYYYRVYSDTDFDMGPGGSQDPSKYSMASPILSFTTLGTAAPGDLSFIDGPNANATDSDAVISFETSVDTTALVEFNVNPGLTPDSRTSGYSQACSDPAACTPPPPVWVSPGTTTHAITIAGLTVPDRVYYYKVTVIDQYNRKISSAVMKFRTSLSRFDHTFTTGECPDGTKIRMCTVDGKFCRPGGIGPVYDCRPGLLCTYMCPAGSTCQDTGDCIQDPSPGESITACNPKSCYLKCDGASGDRSGKRCSVDGDCGAGKCIVGSFTIPAGPGCFGSWSSCDANVILKVRPDRVCNKWYTCKTSFDVGSSSKKTQNQCLDLTICDAISANGQCNNVLEGRQCSNDPLKFCKDDADCVGVGAYCLPQGTNKPLTFMSPEEVSQIKGLTGYAFAGLDWHSAYRWDNDTGAKIPTPTKIDGLFPLSVMQQVGTKVSIFDADFEEFQTNFVCAKNKLIQCSPQPFSSVGSECYPTASDPDNGPCISERDTQGLVARYWESVTPAGSFDTAAISIDAEDSKNNPNQMLRITPTDFAESGARTSTDMNITTGTNSDYMLSVRMKSSIVDQRITVSLQNLTDADKTTHAFDTVTLSTSWQTYLLGPIKGVGTTSISFLTADTSETAVPFWVDDLSMLPALKVNDVQQPIPQTCRLYPNSSAEKCEYTSASGVSFQGLMGYCLERDPMNPAICLSWWPVDVVSGNNIFGRDTAEGYNDRQPLFACAEAAGKYNAPDPVIPSDTSFVNGQADRAMESTSVLSGQPFRNIRVMASRLNLMIHSGKDDPDRCAQTVEDVAACRSGTQRGFCGCFANKTKSVTVYPSAASADGQIFEYNVDKFVVHKLRWTSRWGGMPDDALVLSKTNNWSAYHSRCSDGTTGRAETSVSLTWDPIDHHLTSISWSLKPNDRDDCSGISGIGGGGDDDDNDDDGYWATGLFYMKENCTKLVEVATPTSVMPWLDRTSKAGTYVIPDLGYRYPSDYPPFGTAAAPSVTLDPKDWMTSSGNGLLHVEGPDVTRPTPYQVRGGAAYACSGDCSGRVCVFPGKGADSSFTSCMTSADCIIGGTPPIQGACVGNGVCVDYDPDLNRFSYDDSAGFTSCTYDYAGGSKCDVFSGKRAGRACTTTENCRYTIGRCIPGASTGGGRCDKNSGDKSGLICNKDTQCQTTYNGNCVAAGCPSGENCCPAKNPTCVGGRASKRGPQTFTPVAATGFAPGLACTGGPTPGKACKIDADCGYAAGGRCNGNNQYFSMNHLQRIYAKAYSLWNWSDATRKYVKDVTATLWDAPVKSCRVCSGGTYPDKACSTDADCGAVLPGACVAPVSTCASKATAVLCGVAGGTNPCGWDAATGTCVNRYAGTCNAASLGGMSGKVCNQNSECNPGQPACTIAARHPTENSPLASPATPPDMCKITPRVFNIVNADKPALVDEGSIYILKFNTFIDANQRPLKEVRIDWGDGTENTLGDLSVAPREDPKFPHVYSHVYHCSGKGVCDPYYIKLRIMDNWEICDNATETASGKCRDGLETWTNGPVIQVIR